MTSKLVHVSKLHSARNEKAQATVNDKGVAIVSGFSPAILKAVLDSDDLTPMGVV